MQHNHTFLTHNLPTGSSWSSSGRHLHTGDTHHAECTLTSLCGHQTHARGDTILKSTQLKHLVTSSTSSTILCTHVTPIPTVWPHLHMLCNFHPTVIKCGIVPDNYVQSLNKRSPQNLYWSHPAVRSQTGTKISDTTHAGPSQSPVQVLLYNRMPRIGTRFMCWLDACSALLKSVASATVYWLWSNGS